MPFQKGELPVGAAPPIKKGEIRNPTGRPKGVESHQTKIKRLLQISIKIEDPFSSMPVGKRPIVNLTAHEIIVIAQIQKAMQGDTAAAEWLHARAWGKMVQTQQISVNEGHNLRYQQIENFSDFKEALSEIEEEERQLLEESNPSKIEDAIFQEVV